MVAITRLRPSDTIALDCSVVAALFRAHGAAVAEDILMRRVTALTDAISEMDAHAPSSALLHAETRLRWLSDMAAEIGLTLLSDTLLAVAHAAEVGNTSALPALWDRVKRIGDRSLVMLWDLPQLRM